MSDVASVNEHCQKKGNCYAYALSTIIRATLSRICGRELPSHRSLRHEIVKILGDDGATDKQIERALRDTLTKKYHFQYCKTKNVQEMKEALNNKRPVFVSFDLTKSQWKLFGKALKSNRQTKVFDISEDIAANKEAKLDPEGHCIVLVQHIEGDIYQCKNSWEDAHWGKFLITQEIAQFTKMTFFEIYYEENTLQPIDKQHWKMLPKSHHALWMNYKVDQREKISKCIRELRVVLSKIHQISIPREDNCYSYTLYSLLRFTLSRICGKQIPSLECVEGQIQKILGEDDDDEDDFVLSRDDMEVALNGLIDEYNLQYTKTNRISVMKNAVEMKKPVLLSCKLTKSHLKVFNGSMQTEISDTEEEEEEDAEEETTARTFDISADIQKYQEQGKATKLEPTLHWMTIVEHMEGDVYKCQLAWKPTHWVSILITEDVIKYTKMTFFDVDDNEEQSMYDEYWRLLPKPNRASWVNYNVAKREKIAKCVRYLHQALKASSK